MSGLSNFDENKSLVKAEDDVVRSIFDENGLNVVKNHTFRVVHLIGELAKRYSVDEDKARVSALLHDISAVIRNDERVAYCEEHQIDLIDIETRIPVLSHQKVSRYIARRYFDVKDEDVLSAIESHTTLKKEATDLDKLLFIADKLEWDQKGTPPYRDIVLDGLESSLDYAVYRFMKYMIDNDLLKEVHPDFEEAIHDLKMKVEMDTAFEVRENSG